MIFQNAPSFFLPTQKTFDKEWFQESVDGRDSLYIFVDKAVNKSLKSDPDQVVENLTDHLLAGLYATARTRNINLGPDCGLLEEIVNEGFAGHFMAEQNGGMVKHYYTALSKTEVVDLWGRAQKQCTEKDTNIEKWFWGSKEDKIPPLAALSVGYAVAAHYLQQTGQKSTDALRVSAREVTTVVR